MKKITAALAMSLLLLNSGCMVPKIKKVNVSQVPQPEQERIVGITTKTGQEVRFDPPGAFIKENSIEARVNKTLYEIKLQEVQRLWSSSAGSRPRALSVSQLR